ncbi:MAG: hypothetical protein IJZ35_08025 [Clostridia bacterium]|nr:hypothetical protein [Clostridia bacterium]
MYITFKNNSTSTKMFVLVEQQQYTINTGEYIEVFCNGNKTEFIAQTAAFDEMIDGINEISDCAKNESFKGRILLKLTKKFAEKLPEIMLDTAVKYEISCMNSQNAVVDLSDAAYSVCDGKIADFLDMMPVGILFSRAETYNGQISVLDTSLTNRKKFLRLMRNILLFSHWGFIFVDLFFFIPEYLIIKFFSSHFYINKLFKGLYNLPPDTRTKKLAKKEQQFEMEDKKGCLSGFIKVLIVILAFGGLCWWAISSAPDVIISEDFQSVVCFDEAFVRIDGGLPDDAEKVFLADYTAYYPLADGEYDMDNYYCYIYEDSAGERYMWLKDDCSLNENADKEYDEYENPLVYKSTGEKSD